METQPVLSQDLSPAGPNLLEAEGKADHRLALGGAAGELGMVRIWAHDQPSSRRLRSPLVTGAVEELRAEL